MDRRMAVSEFLTATCAPAIARPERSLTLPEIVPPATCARQALLVTSAIAMTHAPTGAPHTRLPRNRSLRKADRTIASPHYDFRKSEVNPQVWWRLLLLYPSFSGAAAGQFQPESLRRAAQAEVS